MVIAGRKKGSGGRVAEAILGERHPVRIRGGVERAARLAKAASRRSSAAMEASFGEWQLWKASMEALYSEWQPWKAAMGDRSDQLL